MRFLWHEVPTNITNFTFLFENITWIKVLSCSGFCSQCRNTKPRSRVTECASPYGTLRPCYCRSALPDHVLPTPKRILPRGRSYRLPATPRDAQMPARITELQALERDSSPTAPAGTRPPQHIPDRNMAVQSSFDWRHYC